MADVVIHEICHLVFGTVFSHMKTSYIYPELYPFHVILVILVFRDSLGTGICFTSNIPSIRYARDALRSCTIHAQLSNQPAPSVLVSHQCDSAPSTEKTVWDQCAALLVSPALCSTNTGGNIENYTVIHTGSISGFGSKPSCSSYGTCN